MNFTRRSSFARAAPTFGAALALVWLSGSSPSVASIPWPSRFAFGPWLGAATAPAPPVTPEAAAELSVAEAPVVAPRSSVSVAHRPQIDPLARRPFAAEIRAAARRHGVDPLLVAAIVEVESNFAADAVSPKGAVGLMQLMPVHFVDAEHPFDPEANLDLGARYLGMLERRFSDLPLALAAYHAGPGAVERAGGRAPYSSTRWYVARVLSVYDRNRREAGVAELPRLVQLGAPAATSAAG